MSRWLQGYCQKFQGLQQASMCPGARPNDQLHLVMLDCRYPPSNLQVHLPLHWQVERTWYRYDPWSQICSFCHACVVGIRAQLLDQGSDTTESLNECSRDLISRLMNSWWPKHWPQVSTGRGDMNSNCHLYSHCHQGIDPITSPLLMRESSNK